jgi:HTH-type transcriptional regulator/antitoxin HigA
MKMKRLQTETDYVVAMARADELWDAAPDTPESDELGTLAALIDSYEEGRVQDSSSSSGEIDALTFLMEQRGL